MENRFVICSTLLLFLYWIIMVGENADYVGWSFVNRFLTFLGAPGSKNSGCISLWLVCPLNEQDQITFSKPIISLMCENDRTMKFNATFIWNRTDSAFDMFYVILFWQHKNVIQYFKLKLHYNVFNNSFILGFTIFLSYLLNSTQVSFRLLNQTVKLVLLIFAFIF